MATRFLTVGVIALSFAAAAVVGAQHSPTHARPAATDGHQIPFHHLCGATTAPGENRAATHSAQLKAALSLSDAQAATVDRVTTEACEALKKFHEEIIAVLTPEQRARLHDLHGSGRH